MLTIGPWKAKNSRQINTEQAKSAPLIRQKHRCECGEDEGRVLPIAQPDAQRRRTGEEQAASEQSQAA